MSICPKNKSSKGRRDRRRANWKMTAPTLVKCSKCGALTMPHRVCLSLIHIQMCIRDRKYYDLEPVDKALKEVHFPTGTENLMEAKKRIIFDEFFRFFSALELVKDREQQALNHYIIPMEERVKRFIESLPYQLLSLIHIQMCIRDRDM